MNLPTILIGLVILLIFGAIVAKGIYNRRHHKGSCSCGCDSCPGKELCHPETEK